MHETRTTGIFVAAAVALSLVAWLASPSNATGEFFSDVGQEFFPKFKDPGSVAVMEITTWNDAMGQASSFRVENGPKGWTIPSHNGYPADAKERVVKAATGFIDLRKEAVRSDRETEHATLGVVDPSQGTDTAKGRGKLIVFHSAGGEKLAEFIVGDAVANKSGYRYVRIPGQPRVYETKVDADVSTRFEDWIESDLLKVARNDITGLVVNNYKFSPLRRGVIPEGVFKLTKPANDWTLEGIDAENEETSSATVNEILRATDDLKIVGVRRKDPKEVEWLQRGNAFTPMQPGQPVDAVDVELLEGGFIMITDKGNRRYIVAKSGELTLNLKNGVMYSLRHGDIVQGTGLELTAGGGKTPDKPEGASPDGEEKEQEGENRFLMVDVRFDEKLLPEPTEPKAPAEGDKPAGSEGGSAPEGGTGNGSTPEGGNGASGEGGNATEEKKDPKAEYEEAHTKWQTEHDTWKKNVEEGRKKAKELQERFAEWYYVIPNSAYKSLRVSREQLVKTKPKIKSEDIVVGAGDEATAGKKLHVLYTGKLTDGTVFDSNQNREAPFAFVQGKDDVIKGWDQGVLGMRVGGKRKLVIPPELAYGDKAKDKIPANSTLEFEIELLKVEDAPKPE